MSVVVYNVLSPYQYINGAGEEKVGWTEVGVAFPLKSGEGFSIDIRPNVSVAGRLVVMPRAKAARSQGTPPAADPGQDAAPGQFRYMGEIPLDSLT